MESTVSHKIKYRVALLSALMSILIFGLKYYGYRVTGSAAALSDALESIVNVLAAWVALFVIRVAAIPADQNHPYGHGKAESFSSAFEGGLVVFAAITIVVEAVQAFYSQRHIEALGLGAAYIAGAAILNLGLGLYLKKIGTQFRSEALSSSGTHILMDVWTTIGVLLGFALVWFTGIWWLDPLIALLLGIQLSYSGIKIVRYSVGTLMDERDDDVVEELVEKFEKCRKPGIIDIHNMRMIRSGHFTHIDAHVVLPEYWDVKDAHEFLTEFEREVFTKEFEGELAFHIDPCKKSYCRHCEVLNCPIRQHQFEQFVPFTAKSLTEIPTQSNQRA